MTARTPSTETPPEPFRGPPNPPRKVNMVWAQAQLARRILDRLVGYKLSPLLWAKVRKGLSAGRVQSVALRLLVERENEIKAFKTEGFWTIKAELRKGSDTAFQARLGQVTGKKIEQTVVLDLFAAEYRVTTTSFKDPVNVKALPA